MSTQTRGISCALVQPPVAVLLRTHLKAVPPPSRTDHEEVAELGAYDIAPRISHIDRAIIRSYFRQRGHYPPLTQARKNAAPALCKPWRLGGSLPPQLHTALLPGALEQKLSALAVGYERVRVGADVLLIDARTRTIVEILYDISAYTVL